MYLVSQLRRLPRLAVVAAIALTGCLGVSTSPDTISLKPGAEGPPAKSDAVPLTTSSTVEAAPDMATPPDLTTFPDLSRPRPDLTGLLDCYGYAVCDPGNMFCIKFFGGSQATPGAMISTPACYQPADPCANGVLDCACIQNDAVLRNSCGTCVDNQDRTFTCYAVP